MSDEKKTEEAVKAEVKTEVKKKVSWFTSLVVAIVSAAIGVAGTFGLMPKEAAQEKIINSYVHAAAVNEIGGYVDSTVALIKKEITEKEYKENVETLIKAIKAKDFSAALKALNVLTNADSKAKYKETIAKVKAEMEKGQKIAELLKANNNEELRKMFPEAVEEGKKKAGIEDEIVKAASATTETAAKTEAAPAAAAAN